MRRIGGHHPAEDRVQPGWHVRPNRPRGWRPGGEHRQVVVGCLSGDREEERGPEAEHVRAGVYRVRVAGLLGSHESDRPELRAGAGQPLFARQPREPEVEQLRLSV